MHIAVNGIVLNEYGQVLLIRRNDTRTFAPPGGSVEAGELPTDSVAREVREETGLIVMPVRLVGLYFWPTRPDGILTLVFRCIQRGGEIQTSRESPQVGFFGTDPLPSPMIAMHRYRIGQALHHQGGPPQWETQKDTLRMQLAKFMLENVVYRAMDLKRSLLGHPRYVPPPNWHPIASVVVRDENQGVLWIKDSGNSKWKLPDTSSMALEPPWITAARITSEHLKLGVTLTDLSGIYLLEKPNSIRFVFAAKPNEKIEINNSNAADWAFLSPDQEPTSRSSLDALCVRDAIEQTGKAIFRAESTLPGAHDLSHA